MTMKELTPELVDYIQKAIDFAGYRNRRFYYYPPPISADALAKAESCCERELGFPLPAFYRELLCFSNGFSFWGGRFYAVQEEGKKKILNVENLFPQNERFRKRRHEPFRIASHLFVFGEFHFQPLVYDTRAGTFHLMSPLFSWKDTRESLSSFPDLGALLRGILQTREGDAAGLREEWLRVELVKRLGRLRSRAPARFDPRTLPFLQAVLSSEGPRWPPAPASPEALAAADRRCEREYGYPLPLFYRDFLRQINGFKVWNVFYPIDDPQAPRHPMRVTSDLFEGIEDFRRSAIFDDEEACAYRDDLFCFGEAYEAYYVCHLPSASFHEIVVSEGGLGDAFISAPDFDSFVKDLFDDVPLPSSEDGAGKEE